MKLLNINEFGIVFHLRMHQLGVIRDKQAFSAAEVARGKNTSFLVQAQECFCLSRMTSEISHGSLLTAKFVTASEVNGQN